MDLFFFCSQKSTLSEQVKWIENISLPNFRDFLNLDFDIKRGLKSMRYPFNLEKEKSY